MSKRPEIFGTLLSVFALGTGIGVGCTKGGGEKASLPPAQPAVSVPPEHEVAPQEPPPGSLQGQGVASPSPREAAPQGTATEAPPSVPQSPAPGEKPSSPASAEGTKPALGSMEPGRITPSPANDLASAVDYRLTGEVQATRRSQVAFRVPGILHVVTAKPGTAAKKGTVLATLDDRDFVLRLELAKARREQARVALESAQRDLKREMELKSANASTATVLEKTKAAADQARLSLRLAELDVQGADLALKDTKLVAPYDSVVATQLKYEGENVPAGTAVYEVYDTAEPEISLTVPERLLGQITVHSKLTITIPSVAFNGSGRVIRQVPVINERTRTFQVTVKLDAYDPKIVPGLYAEGILN